MQCLHRELHDAAVIGHETVELVLHVAQLRVHRGAEALRDGGADLLVIERLERVLERERGVARLVADALAADGVALDAVDIAAELRQQRGAAELIGLEPVLLDRKSVV